MNLVQEESEMLDLINRAQKANKINERVCYCKTCTQRQHLFLLAAMMEAGL